MSRPWVLISGASSGFGEASAKQLAREGLEPVADQPSTKERLEEVAKRAGNMGATVHVEAWDMRDRQATQEGVED